MKIILPINVPMYPRIEQSVKIGHKYEIVTQIEGIKGEKFSAYFGVGIPYGNNQIKDVKIRWLNDFSKNQKVFRIIFKAESTKIIIFYRFNSLTPVKSNLEYNVLPIEKISFKQISNQVEECFDNPNFNVSQPLELTVEQELLLEQNIVWIFGSPRSGTTWVSKNLLSSETMVFEEPRIGDYLKIIEIFSLQEDYIFSEKYKTIWKPYLRKLILYRIYSQFRDYKKKIIVKEPNGSVGAKMITECLPNSKSIIIFRDGRDVLDSLHNGLSDGGWISKMVGYKILPQTKLEWIKSEATKWTNLTNDLLKTFLVKPEQFRLLLKYEDINSKTAEMLKIIYGFLDLNIDEKKIREIVDKFDFKKISNELKGDGKFYRSAKHEKWKESFNLEEREIMEKIMGKTLKKLENL